ncbi:hypothetical protein ILUMI_01789 [Ignelater luminosus]|uniref:CCHC-type domain-containing protein n=1 Tax=Ignelater luminosus TaxID=2038154 RepID=A0A8K0DJH9_IGNLU|nr:hypothetical protein ILUMI_01789 [Ignelater luminosus]
MDTLLRQRGSVKARLTRFEDYLCGIKTKIETNNGVLENCNAIQIRKRLLTIQPLLDTFDQLQLQIENASEDPEKKLSSHDNLPAKPSSVVSCHEVLVPGPVAVPSDVVSINGGSQSSSSTGHKGFVKLSTINLPNLNGNPEEWLNFRDLFINLIHENEVLTDVHKLHYLRASLTGKAAETIKSLAISSANYQIAWDSVNDRFNNSRILVHNHIKALFNIEVTTKESSAKLRQLIDSLDPTTTRGFENKNDSDKFPSYEELISFMEKKASLLETIDQRNQKSHTERLTAKAFVSTAISCPLCKGSHSLNSCERFKQFGLKERSEKAKELKVCYNCLAKGHFTGKCKSRFNCQRCKSRHHTLLHQVESVSSVEVEQATVNLSAFGSNQTTVLLSTALVRILDSDGNLHPARALLDSGSMSNFISESLCKRLQLSRFPVDLQIPGSTVLLEIISSNSQFQMKSSCLLIPHITGNIPEAKVDITGKWLSFRSELVHLNDIKIPRHVVCNNSTRIELHGFADSSTFAYGGCLYIRSINEKNQVFTRLLCSKTRVAPLKTITIIKLSAALILARLASQVMRAIQTNFSKCVLWSDSTVTLGWLKTPPNLLKTFVANRVAEIQEMTEHATWKHVPTNSNPADLLSRGVPLKELANSSLWWSGPAWLSLPQESWPKPPVQAPVLPGLKDNAVNMLTVDLPVFPFANYSNLNKLERIVAYWLRFTENCRKRLGDRNVQPTSFREIQTAQRRLVKIAQAESFQTEIHLLENGKPLKSTSRLLNLGPFLDSRIPSIIITKNIR